MRILLTTCFIKTNHDITYYYNKKCPFYTVIRVDPLFMMLYLEVLNISQLSLQNSTFKLALPSILLTTSLPQFMVLFSEIPNEECNLKSILTLAMPFTAIGSCFPCPPSDKRSSMNLWHHGDAAREGCGWLDHIVHAWTEQQTFFGSNNMRNAREPTTL